MKSCKVLELDFLPGTNIFACEDCSTCAILMTAQNPSPRERCGRKLLLEKGNSIGLGKISTESGYRNRFENPYIFDCSRV
jgi:hypothetical protein